MPPSAAVVVDVHGRAQATVFLITPDQSSRRNDGGVRRLQAGTGGDRSGRGWPLAIRYLDIVGVINEAGRRIGNERRVILDVRIICIALSIEIQILSRKLVRYIILHCDVSCAPVKVERTRGTDRAGVIDVVVGNN